jgi:DNA-binding NarL/FixJ family response regulator
VHVRVLIADDEPLFADALAALLEADGRVEVVGRAFNGRQAVELAHSLGPDLVLMDLSMPGVDGIDATRELTANGGMRVLVLTGSEDPADIARARSAGAAGYLTKDRIAETLVDAILAAGGD